ncbi:MAG: cytochrome c biogenesis protein CcsA [Planctomycetota bacterium]|nr:cytochrome c biogenesis protein CcsA [Planctomycetota bacterium]
MSTGFKALEKQLMWMEKVSVFCFLASYVVATAFAFLRFRGQSRLNHVLTVAASVAGLLAHTVYLLVRSRSAHLPPLMASSHDWLLVLAWVAVLIYLFLTLLDWHLPLGAFVLPVVLVLVIASRFVSLEPNPLVNAKQLAEQATRGWVMLHVSMLIFGIAGVIGGLILATMYLIQHRRLKHKQGMQEGVALPSLARLARWNWWAVVISVPTLTLGLAAGVLLGVVESDAEARLSFGDPLMIGSGVGWLVMLGLFSWLVSTRRAAAKQVALLTVWACGFLLLTIVGLQVLTGSGHKLLAG